MPEPQTSLTAHVRPLQAGAQVVRAAFLAGEPALALADGIVAFKDDPKRFVFQGVHMMLDGDTQRDWKAGEKRESKVVFIGRDLKEEDIRKGFLACAA